jgi:hypothetical protein
LGPHICFPPYRSDVFSDEAQENARLHLYDCLLEVIF